MSCNKYKMENNLLPNRTNTVEIAPDKKIYRALILVHTHKIDKNNREIKSAALRIDNSLAVSSFAFRFCLIENVIIKKMK